MSDQLRYRQETQFAEAPNATSKFLQCRAAPAAMGTVFLEAWIEMDHEDINPYGHYTFEWVDKGIGYRWVGCRAVCSDGKRATFDLTGQTPAVFRP